MHILADLRFAKDAGIPLLRVAQGGVCACVMQQSAAQLHPDQTAWLESVAGGSRKNFGLPVRLSLVPVQGHMVYMIVTEPHDDFVQIPQGHGTEVVFEAGIISRANYGRVLIGVLADRKAI